MGPYTSFSGVRVISMSLGIPLLGLWVADVTLASDAAIPPVGQLAHGNLTLQGAVYRSASFAGTTTARLVGGFGGWSKNVGAMGYSLPFGVTLSMVLGDAALEVGEQVAVISDRSLGNSWSRPAGPAGRTLRAAAGASWYVNALGVVQVAPRPATAIVSPWQAVDWQGGPGIMTIATEDPASWQPGATFASATVPKQTIAYVRHSVGNDGRARMRVMVSP